MRFLKVTAVITVAVLSGSLPVTAESKLLFFRPDSAKTIFSAHPDDLDAPAPRGSKESSQDQAVLSKAPVADTAIGKDSPLLSADDVKAHFGDPLSDPPVVAQDNAPGPFKAMLAALEVNDETLAFQYARQYVRYQERQRRAANQAMAYMGFAMEREGMLGDKAWPSSPEFEQYRSALPAEDPALTKPAKLSNTAKAAEILERVKHVDERVRIGELQDEDKVDRPASYEEPHQKEARERRERARLRAELAKQVPVDPKGEVEIYFFFKPNDSAAGRYAPVVEQLFQKVGKDSRVNFIGMASGADSGIDLDAFKRQAKITFPTIHGGALAAKLNIQHTPAMLFRSPNTGAAWQEPGERELFYLEEVLNLMQGRSGG